MKNICVKNQNIPIIVLLIFIINNSYVSYRQNKQFPQKPRCWLQQAAAVNMLKLLNKYST
jgi:hypothetical protein